MARSKQLRLSQQQQQLSQQQPPQLACDRGDLLARPFAVWRCVLRHAGGPLCPRFRPCVTAAAVTEAAAAQQQQPLRVHSLGGALLAAVCLIRSIVRPLHNVMPVEIGHCDA